MNFSELFGKDLAYVLALSKPGQTLFGFFCYEIPESLLNLSRLYASDRHHLRKEKAHRLAVRDLKKRRRVYGPVKKGP